MTNKEHSIYSIAYDRATRKKKHEETFSLPLDQGKQHTRFLFLSPLLELVRMGALEELKVWQKAYLEMAVVLPE